ncbi:MAG: fibronectin type III domain-containing protein [Mariprofundaceae bacterium]|nr:fibronectin type III domain-containing protein [Mariprofundaceae bacterium]
MRKFLLFFVITAFVLAGCGRKEPPQPIADNAPPALVSVEHIITGNSLKLDMVLSGGSGGLGYQIDRAEMDPYCKCPGEWRRYYEEMPNPKNFDKPSLSKLINLRGGDMEYVFRVRAVDALGRFSEWSKPIRARAVILFE